MTDALKEIAKKLVRVRYGRWFWNTYLWEIELKAIEARVAKLKPHKATLVYLMAEGLEEGWDAVCPTPRGRTASIPFIPYKATRVHYGR